ncbi:SH2 domain containing 3Cb [Pseudoliparis swirei]|uniref:SH2 domain containing 3Cb n=1 Tax=Pseudoliparis swirei TaxID=2059687 RepID=UPI0024BE3D39|nr:SH2 domain containing 3Cb [Pseudoliparis swirei]
MNTRKLSFKWFGSLTNLSARRPSQKTNTKAAPEHHGSLGGQKSVDDMEPRLHTPGYACSSQMYTHVGTVPRSQKKSCTGLKEKNKNKKKKEDEEEGEGQREAGEHVRDSPLLSALSGLSETSLDRTLPGPAPARPLPSIPSLVRASPLTSAHESRFNGRLADPLKSRSGSREALERETSDMTTNGITAASPQDVYVPMDPIAEAARSQSLETGKDESVAQEVERVDGQQNVAQRGGEYVKFSKEKFWLEPTDELKKQLEAELKLSGSNLESHGWYHGAVPWEVSESLVVNHGDFLVRHSRSSRGDFVLTGRWEQEAVHFLVRRTAAPRVQYRLEGEAFDSLPALVHFYAGSRAALTQWSGARIHRPVNRKLPLGHLEAAFCHWEGGSGEEEVRPRSPSSLHMGAEVDGEQHHRPPLTAGEASLSPLNNNNGLPVPLFPAPDGDGVALAPPLFPLAPSLSHPNPDPPSSEDLGSCYTELQPGPRSYVERLRAEDGSAGIEDGNVYSTAAEAAETVSSFKPGGYRSRLMPGDNKPLEVGVLRRVKELLAEVDPRTTAKHITKTNCVLARILEVTPEELRMMGVSSGMELLTLPHGRRLRLDLLERFHTMATALAVQLLGCTSSTEERAGLLHKLIQIAAELKTTTGDMFGFTAVMRALELPQVSRLEQTWTALRQRHTEGAILYEKTLRPFMKSLNDGRESCPLSSTSFPHVMPLLALMEKSVAVGEGAEPWEVADVELDVVMFHLGAARTIAQLGGIYSSNAESKLRGFTEQPEVLELFLTDFQMRLLWGSRGAEESQALRYAKFDQVLTALSVRLEPPGRRRGPRPSC